MKVLKILGFAFLLNHTQTSFGQEAILPYSLDAKRLARAIEEKPGTFIIVDVRTQQERAELGTPIPGTKAWLPIDERYAQNQQYLHAYVDQFLKLTNGKKDTHIVLYCFFQMHSIPIGQLLMSAGFTNVYSLDGGVNSWHALMDGRQ